MRPALTALSQMAVMAAIVATLVYVPLAAALGLVLFLIDVPYEALLTFGGALHTVLGLLAWWALVFGGACGYAAWVFPWGDKALGSGGS